MGVSAATLTVCDGQATSSNVPVYGFYADAYLKCEYVIPADQLTGMNGQVITQLDWYLSSPATDPWSGAIFQIFLAEVNSTGIGAFYGTDNATIVYQGELDGSQDVLSVVFDEPYTYNGGNLLVGVYNTVPSSYRSASFYGENVEGASQQGYSYTSLDAVNGSQRNFIPKTTFTYNDEVTAISTMKAEDNGVVRYYDISGRYVGTSIDNAPTGLYIGSNGKKVVK